MLKNCAKSCGKCWPATGTWPKLTSISYSIPPDRLFLTTSFSFLLALTHRSRNTQTPALTCTSTYIFFNCTQNPGLSFQNTCLPVPRTSVCRTITLASSSHTHLPAIDTHVHTTQFCLPYTSYSPACCLSLPTCMHVCHTGLCISHASLFLRNTHLSSQPTCLPTQDIRICFLQRTGC